MSGSDFLSQFLLPSPAGCLFAQDLLVCFVLSFCAPSCDLFTCSLLSLLLLVGCDSKRYPTSLQPIQYETLFNEYRFHWAVRVYTDNAQMTSQRNLVPKDPLPVIPCDVVAAMLMVWNNKIFLLWELTSIFMQTM